MPEIKTPIEVLMEMFMFPLRVGGALAEGAQKVANGQGLPRRRHSPWGEPVQTTTTNELNDMNIY